MCQIYIVLPSNIAETQKNFLQIFEWHHVDILQLIKKKDHYIYEIQMDSVVDPCFGKHQTVYYPDPENLFNNLPKNDLDSQQKYYLLESIKVDAERQKRWCLLSADEWIAFLTSLVEKTAIVKLFYAYKDLKQNYKNALQKTAQQILITNLSADTLLNLTAETPLVISLS